eukprot:5128329-Prymnesium_polylepis.1
MEPLLGGRLVAYGGTRTRGGHQVGSRPYLVVRCSSWALPDDRNCRDLRRGNSGGSSIILNF